MDTKKLLSQGNQPSKKPWLNWNLKIFDISIYYSASGASEFPRCNLLPAKLLASNSQVEEVLVILLLVTDLDPRPFANLW